MHNSTRRVFEIAGPVQHLWGRLCAIGLVALLVGCGREPRVPLDGTVTLNGRPLEKGYIHFSPLAGTDGPSAGANIVDGKFTVPGHGGPFAGKFRVEITAADLTGRKVPNRSGTAMVDEYVQALPARYNTESQLQADITAHGPNRFDFALSSGKTPKTSTQ